MFKCLHISRKMAIFVLVNKKRGILSKGPSEMKQVLRMQREQTNYLQTNLKKGTKENGK